MPSGNFRSPYGMYPKYEKFIKIPVLDFVTKSNGFKHYFHGYRTGFIDFPNQNVCIDPYFLGVWLGDGTSSETAITTMDPEIVNYIYSMLKLHPELYIRITKNHSYNPSKENKSKTYHLVVRSTKGIAQGMSNTLRRLFRQQNLLNNKHIPQQYISNTEEVRLSLLAGLLDTDGTVVTGGYDITQKNEKLINQIKLLADTLGFRAIKREIYKTCQTGKTGKYFDLSINGEVWKIPCKVPRKIILKENIHKNKNFLINGLKIRNAGVGAYFILITNNPYILLKDGTVL